MKKLLSCAAILLSACALALCLGCSSTSASSASAEGSTSAASSTAAAASSAGLQTGATTDISSLGNGEYQIEVTLTGGSGKATVESPAKINVADGKVTAVIVWSSPNYDQMVVDGEQYFPVPRAGNSTFEIPVAAFDEDLPIQAETTAMSEPHMIDYTLHFDSSTLQ